MIREEIVAHILKLLKEEFEIADPDLDVNLTEEYEFDSIDAIALLEHLEEYIDSPLTQDEKKEAMEIRTINQICNFIERIIRKRDTE